MRKGTDDFNARYRSFAVLLLLDHGGKTLLSPRIKSSYYNRSTLRSLWRQYFQYGYWKLRVMRNTRVPRWGDRHTRSSLYPLAADTASTNEAQDVVTVSSGSLPYRHTE